MAFDHVFRGIALLRSSSSIILTQLDAFYFALLRSVAPLNSVYTSCRILERLVMLAPAFSVISMSSWQGQIAYRLYIAVFSSSVFAPNFSAKTKSISGPRVVSLTAHVHQKSRHYRVIINCYIHCHNCCG